jgi:hypothetical protein
VCLVFLALLQQARDEDYLARLLLDQLPALGERVQMIREGKAATSAAENDRQLERSQVGKSGRGGRDGLCVPG